MVSPTKELLAKLDEMGVEYTTTSLFGEEVHWKSADGHGAKATSCGKDLLVHAIMSPEQAIAATVGVDSDTGEAIRRLLDKLNTELCNAGCVIECETREERKRLIDAVKDKYVHVIAATVGKDIERYDGSGRRGTVAILQGGRKPEEVMFVRDEGGVTHYLPEGVGTCHAVLDQGYYKGINGVCEGLYCSKCKEPLSLRFKHCPWCGRKIKED